MFGYENMLDAVANKSWVVPEVLKFVLRAAQDKAHPYVLILDEMNLAHVERYFGDFLSGTESRKPVLPNLQLGEDGAWRLANPNPKIAIPENLIVLGTVNVDETTYMFSPKVLDRANCLELRVSTEDLNLNLAAPKECAPASGVRTSFARGAPWDRHDSL
jgi:5-methylcytosine-specific restriction enzyme B